MVDPPQIPEDAFVRVVPRQHTHATAVLLLPPATPTPSAKNGFTSYVAYSPAMHCATGSGSSAPNSVAKVRWTAAGELRSNRSQLPDFVDCCNPCSDDDTRTQSNAPAVVATASAATATAAAVNTFLFIEPFRFRVTLAPASPEPVGRYACSVRGVKDAEAKSSSRRMRVGLEDDGFGPSFPRFRMSTERARHDRLLAW